MSYADHIVRQARRKARRIPDPDVAEMIREGTVKVTRCPTMIAYGASTVRNIVTGNAAAKRKSFNRRRG